MRCVRLLVIILSAFAFSSAHSRYEVSSPLRIVVASSNGIWLARVSSATEILDENNGIVRLYKYSEINDSYESVESFRINTNSLSDVLISDNGDTVILNSGAHAYAMFRASTEKGERRASLERVVSGTFTEELLYVHSMSGKKMFSLKFEDLYDSNERVKIKQGIETDVEFQIPKWFWHCESIKLSGGSIIVHGPPGNIFHISYLSGEIIEWNNSSGCL